MSVIDALAVAVARRDVGHPISRREVAPPCDRLGDEVYDVFLAVVFRDLIPLDTVTERIVRIQAAIELNQPMLVACRQHREAANEKRIAAMLAVLERWKEQILEHSEATDPNRSATYMKTRTWNPRDGQAFQGDVAIVPVPAGIAIATTDDIKPVDGRLVLQEGEVTGHHHAIRLPQPTMFRDDALAHAAPAKTSDAKLASHFGRTAVSARMFRDPVAVAAMISAGVLERGDLCVGFLRVEGGDAVVRHEEHDAIAIPPGDYYVGRQVESVGAEERTVAD